MMYLVIVITILTRFNGIYLAPLDAPQRNISVHNMTTIPTTTLAPAVISSTTKRSAAEDIEQTSEGFVSTHTKIDNSTLRVKAMENGSKYLLFSEGNWTHGTINIGGDNPENYVLTESPATNTEIIQNKTDNTKNVHVVHDQKNSSENTSVSPEDTLLKYDVRFNLTNIANILKAKVSESQDRFLCTPILENNNELYTSDDIIISFDGNGNTTRKTDAPQQKFVVIHPNISDPTINENEKGKNIVFICTVIPLTNCTETTLVDSREEETNETDMIGRHFKKFVEDTFQTKNDEAVTFNINEGINNYNLYNVPSGDVGSYDDRIFLERQHHAQEEHMKSNENILRNILFELTRLNDLQWYQYISSHLQQNDNSDRQLNIYSRANPINTPSDRLKHHPLEEISNMIKFILNLEQYAMEGGMSKYNAHAKAILKNLVERIDRGTHEEAGKHEKQKNDDTKGWNKSQMEFIISIIQNLINNKTHSGESMSQDDIFLMPDDTQNDTKKPHKIVTIRGPGGRKYLLRRTLDNKSVKSNLNADVGNPIISHTNKSPKREPFLEALKTYQKTDMSNDGNMPSLEILSPDVEVNTNVENYQDLTTINSFNITEADFEAYVEGEIDVSELTQLPPAGSNNDFKITDPDIKDIEIITGDSRVQLKLHLN